MTLTDKTQYLDLDLLDQKRIFLDDGHNHLGEEAVNKKQRYLIQKRFGFFTLGFGDISISFPFKKSFEGHIKAIRYETKRGFVSEWEADKLKDHVIYTSDRIDIPLSMTDIDMKHFLLPKGHKISKVASIKN